MSSFRWGMVACWTPTNSQVTGCELRQLLFSAHCSTVVFFCFAFCFCLSPPGWEKVLSLEMMWTWLGALSFDVNGLYESQTTFPFLWGSNLNQNKPVDPFLDSSPIQNQASLVFGYLFQLLIKFDLHDFTFDFTNNGEHNHLGLVHEARHPIKAQGLLQWVLILGILLHHVVENNPEC